MRANGLSSGGSIVPNAPIVKVHEGWESFTQSLKQTKAVVGFLLPTLLVGVELVPGMHEPDVFLVHMRAFLLNTILSLTWFYLVPVHERATSRISWVLVYAAFVNMLALFAQEPGDPVPLPSRLCTLYLLFGYFGVLDRKIVFSHFLCFIAAIKTGVIFVESSHSVTVASVKGLVCTALMEDALMRLLRTTIAEIVKQTVENLQAKNKAGKQMVLAQAHDMRHFVQAVSCTWENLDTEEVKMPQRTREQFEACLGAIRLSLDSYIFASSGPVGQEGKAAPADVVSLARKLVAVLVRGSQFGNSHQVEAAVQQVGEVPPVLVKQVAIQQMLVSALLNALKFTMKGKITVEIEYILLAEMLYLRIKDTGPGMTSHQTENLSNMFATSRHGASYGFGGFIMKEACAMHGGEMSIESEKGKGTTVEFAISAKLASATAVAAKGATLAPQKTTGVGGGRGGGSGDGGGSEGAAAATPALAVMMLQPQKPLAGQPLPKGKLKLLVVDDCVAIADVMVTLVRRKLGHLVSVAAAAYSGTEALELIDAAAAGGADATEAGGTGSFDVVLTDQQMPQMTGLELIETCKRRAREQPEAPNPKFFVFSADVYHTTRVAIGAAGVRLLVKPVSIGEIGEVLESVISAKCARG
jgi:CheY-like chemotaxis protein